LFRLSAAIGHEPYFDAYHYALRTLLTGWGDRVIEGNAEHPPEIVDDGSPFAFALAFGPDGVELRFVAEAQSMEASPESMRSAALGVNRELAGRFPVDFTRFGEIRDLLLDDDLGPPFSVWHSVRWTRASPPRFRLYLTPRTRSIARADVLLRKAVRRLGLGEQTESYLDHMTRRPGDVLRHLSLDLARDEDARVTVYAVHYEVCADELEDIARTIELPADGEISAFATTMIGHAGPYLWKPVTSSASFVPGSFAPVAVAVHLPISHYLETDAVSVQRFSKFLNQRSFDDLSYRRAVHVLPARALDVGIGVQCHVSYGRDAKGPRLVAMLSPELSRTA
jgi:hypothetical protein